MWDWISDIENFIQMGISVILLLMIGTILTVNVFGFSTLNTQWITIPIEEEPSILSAAVWFVILCFVPSFSGLLRSNRRWIEDADISGNIL